MVSETDNTLPMFSFSPELEPYYSIRQRCKRICQQLNRTSPVSVQERKQLVQSLIKADFPVFIEPSFRCEYGENIRLGSKSFINHHVTINDSAPVTIGCNVLIGPNCSIDTVITNDANGVYCAPIDIGNNVWIGANVTIFAGVKIGNNAIIGAGAIVKSSVGSDEIVKNKQ